MPIPDTPHRRYNSLTGEWVLVSAHRTARPWQGKQDEVAPGTAEAYDPECYLCPGNLRANGDTNPDYDKTFVFTNDFPALLPEGSQISGEDSVLTWQPASGTSRVICYSPRHDLSLGNLTPKGRKEVILAWQQESRGLLNDYEYVQVFENRGALMGASNPHPHGQIWAGDFQPTEIEKEVKHQAEYFSSNAKPLLQVYLDSELLAADRVVYRNDSWVILVPFWAVWPFETLLLPSAHIETFENLDDQQIDELEEALRVLWSGYDHLFATEFPFSMGWHQVPRSRQGQGFWTLHAHFYPPLLRSATVRKFMVGYEMLAEAQRDLTPESAAERLRSVIQDINK